MNWIQRDSCILIRYRFQKISSPFSMTTLCSTEVRTLLRRRFLSDMETLASKPHSALYSQGTSPQLGRRRVPVAVMLLLLPESTQTPIRQLHGRSRALSDTSKLDLEALQPQHMVANQEAQARLLRTTSSSVLLTAPIGNVKAAKAA